MNIQIKNDFQYHHELRSSGDCASALLSSTRVTGQLAQLVEEAYTVGVLADQLSAEADQIDVAITPNWSTEPAVGQIDVSISAAGNGRPQVVSRRFESGPWVRQCQQVIEQLRAEGALAGDASAYRMLVATRPRDPATCDFDVRPFQAPVVERGTLDQLGAGQLGDGALVPDRPVLLGQRMVEEAIELCEAAGSNETGGAVLGKIIRLPAALPGTATRIVTVLTTIITDRRHQGNQTRFHLSPEALAEAAQVAEMRGTGESVLTIFHTHGWGCGECNEKACPLAECYPSLVDYELEALFPTKALLLPIAGRKQGAPGRRPVLQVHAWRGGELKPIRWQTFQD